MLNLDSSESGLIVLEQVNWSYPQFVNEVNLQLKISRLERWTGQELKSWPE